MTTTVWQYAYEERSRPAVEGTGWIREWLKDLGDTGFEVFYFRESFDMKLLPESEWAEVEFPLQDHNTKRWTVGKKKLAVEQQIRVVTIGAKKPTEAP